jgi:N-methylhydantoinase A
LVNGNRRSIVRIGSDIGGTFTDIAVVGSDGELFIAKVPSTPADFAAGLIEGVRGALASAAKEMSSVTEVLHGCTVATNAILEQRGARTGLFTTYGFRDVLELRRIRVPRLYDPLYEKPKPLVPRELRFEIDERVAADGTVIKPLSDESVRAALALVERHALEAVAVCLLHSYRNPAHELTLGTALRHAFPDLFVSLSVEVLPEIREYERTSTTVVNSYIGPPVSRYLASTKSSLVRAGICAPLILMQSSGGVASAEEISRLPAQIVECGPAAGVIGAAKLSAAMGLSDVITFDMGGTTAKASLVENGRVFLSDTYEIGSEISSGGIMAGGAGYALRLPVVDVAEVGAGGGSLVSVDRGGAICVGPRSAGADPGPACYGRGNTAPTVTDANLVLGYIGTQSLAGGHIRLDSDLARKAIDTAVCAKLGGSIEDAAFGIRRVANARMARAIKSVSTFKGRDPRRCVLIAYGGNGGVHGPDLARSLEIKRVLVPPAPGVFSALGLLWADLEASAIVPIHRPLQALDPISIRNSVEKIRPALTASLGDRATNAVLSCAALMRYEGQAYELEVAVPLEEVDSPALLSTLRERFELEHLTTYGHKPHHDHGVEVASLRVRLRRPSSSTVDGLLQSLRPESKKRPSRACYFGKDYGLIETKVLMRGAIPATAVSGPMIIEDIDGTTVIPPDAMVSRDRLNNLLIDCM